MNHPRTVIVLALIGFAVLLIQAYALAQSNGDVGLSGVSRWRAEAKARVEQENKETVVRFYDEALNKKDPEEALKYVGAHYKQHTPRAEDGRDGLRRFIDWVRTDYPDSRSAIKQIFADGDYVILNVHMVRRAGERGLAIAEIFRLEDGKIVEHWDRIQQVPGTSANHNGMF